MKLPSLLCAALMPVALSAQNTVTVTTGSANGTQTWYSLQNGVVDDRPLAEWDIAFEITGITGGVLVNTAKGIEVYKAPYTIAQWASVDTAGLAASWPEQHNSVTDWSSGALNQGLTANPFDLGWGIYNMVTHNVVGDSCFVIKLADGTWKKLRIDGYASATDNYTWTWADLDGANELSNTLNRATFAGRNYGYVSLEANSVFDHEPPTVSWDLLFTKYLAFVPQPVPSMYPVAGVLQNRDIEARRVDGVDASYTDWGSGPMSADINVIGFDWKTFNMQTFQWEYATDRVHFVRDRDGNIWKLVFTAYGGSSNGDITFTQELMSATSIDEQTGGGSFVLYPNPSTDAQVQLVLDGPQRDLDVLVFDGSGRLVDSFRIRGGDLSVHVLHLAGAAPGIYTVRLLGEGVASSARLVLQ